LSEAQRVPLAPSVPIYLCARDRGRFRFTSFSPNMGIAGQFNELVRSTLEPYAVSLMEDFSNQRACKYFISGK
jgi:hypothetical protein